MEPGLELVDPTFKDDNSVRSSVTLWLSQPAFEALAGAGEPHDSHAAARLEVAIRCYLGDRGSGRPAWPYPGFLRASETQQDVELSADVDAELFGSFAAEAERQSVSVQQLAEHAAFYLAAEIDAGRATQRILDDLERSDEADR
jgi:hypothetical protein